MCGGDNMADALEYEEESLFTYADYRSWELKEGERYELIYGIAYAMAAPNDYHQSISGELFRQIAIIWTANLVKYVPPLMT
jgi:Uma2 family endonuclease